MKRIGVDIDGVLNDFQNLLCNFLRNHYNVNPEDVKIMCIVTLPADNSGVTANLQGPLIINKANNKCMKIILTDERWQTKHNLLEQVKQGAN